MAQSTYPGEFSCGDAWATEADRILVADGLGHGLQAAEAAMAAVEAFEGNWRRSPRDAMEAMHLALRPTRGAAAAVVQADRNANTLRFCGVGNISGSVVGMAKPRSRGKWPSQNGIVGHEVHRIIEFEYPWPEDALLILHSDGISAKWDLAAYPGLALRPASLIAAVLYRDFRRPNDDATIVVARLERLRDEA